MATINRFSTTDRAAISFTGNTLGLIGTFNPSQATTSAQADGIGTFITTNTSLQSPGGYPTGTTQTFSLNKSSAILTLLPGSTVLYAELIWNGIASNALQNVSGSINNAIQLTTPLGNTVNVSPNPSTSQSIPNIFFSLTAYTRTADVTNIITTSGAGTYTVANVPCALGGNNTSSPGDFESNFAGWTLAVVYRNPILNFRNVTLWVLFQRVGPQEDVDIPVSGFNAPSFGPLSARLAISVASGDSYISGDSLLFGPNTSSLSLLSGPNNTTNNFFSSQVNYSNSEVSNVGQLNTTGTFGSNNQPIGNKSLNGRQGWDITNVSASSAITYNQTSAVARFITSGDLYAPNAIALQVDINAANLISISKFVDKAFANINETLTYTVTFKNTGSTTANNTVFIDTIPTNTIFVPGSFFVDGALQPGGPGLPGTTIGNIAPNVVSTIVFKVTTTTIATPNPVKNQGGVGYNFISGPGIPSISAFDVSSIVNTQINHVDVSISKSTNKNFANIGDIITYTIPITTIGNVSAINVLLIDTIPDGTAFIAGSLSQDGLALAGNPNPPGASLNTIGINKISTVSFKVLVTTFPNPNPIPNSASTTFSYTVDPSTTPNVLGSGGNSSNTVTTQVNSATLASILKLVDKNFANCGDVITYTIVIPNTGNVTAQNVVFKDTIPNGTLFVNNSVTINGFTVTLANPSTGISIPNIGPSTTTTLSFKVIVSC